MRLFIAEKPSLGRAIANALGTPEQKEGYCQIEDDIVTWCFGHILELKDPHEYQGLEHLEKWKLEDLPLPIEPGNFQLKPSKDSYKQFQTIKKLLSKADEVVNAGDPDREGQLLIDEVLTYCKYSGPIQRVLISDMNPKNVKKALQNLKPNKDYKTLYHSAQARSFADWIYGLNLTRFYTLKAQEMGYPGTISIGRVQTPILGLIVNRYKEHNNHVPITYFVLQVIANYEYTPIEFALQSEEMITSKEIISSIQKTIEAAQEIQITDINTTRKKIAVPLPFSLVELQKKLASDFGYSPEKVLSLIQSLYEEHKLLTYPRSDCSYLPEEHFEERMQIIENLKTTLPQEPLLNELDPGIKNKAWNDKKVTAHHAIIPTMKKANLENLSQEEQNVYLTVAHRYLLQFTKEYVYDATVIMATAASHELKATGNKIIELGWRAYEKTEQKETPLPSLANNIKLPIQETKVTEKKTTPPALFTDATLLESITKIAKYVKNPDLAAVLKETSGIGTPATQATIIEGLFKRKFVERKKKKIIPTPIGISLIELLPESLSLPDITAYWELLLSDIEEGKLSKNEFCTNLHNQVANILKKQWNTEVKIEGFKNGNKGDAYKCPKCGNKTIKKGSYGFFCTDKENCKFSLSQTLLGKKLTDKQLENLLSGKEIKNLKGLKKKDGTEFDVPVISLDADAKIQFKFPKQPKSKKK